MKPLYQPFVLVLIAMALLAMGEQAGAQMEVTRVEATPARVFLNERGEAFVQVTVVGKEMFNTAPCGIEVEFGGAVTSDHFVFNPLAFPLGTFSDKWQRIRALPIQYTKRLTLPGKYRVRAEGALAGLVAFPCPGAAEVSIEVLERVAKEPPPPAPPTECDLQCLAEKSEPQAVNDLGLQHLNGNGKPQSDSEAAKWFRKGSELKHAAAAFNLGFLYQEGRGVPQSYERALQQFEYAASLGSAEAMHAMSLMYAQGPIPAKNLVTAHAWSNLAAARLSGENRDKALQVKRQLERVLTAAEIRDASRIAEELDARYRPPR